MTGEEVADVVVRRVVEATLDRSHLDEIVHETVYTEHARLAGAVTGPHAAEDEAWVAHVRHELAHADAEKQCELVYEVVQHYTTEISGHFDRYVYGVATSIVPEALGLLLHGAVEDRVVLEGETETLRSLVKVGTVMLVPTHVSNLDSMLLGHAIDRLGLPPFAYGAGLNLFSNPVIGFFLRNLGAYTVDRKKTDPLYRTTLRAYAAALLERGQHMLVFPGGTRSRSGAIETHLKKGLLGTTTEALRLAREAHRTRNGVFIVPCTLTYPLVLEASSLIDDWLRAEGGPHYVDVKDEFDRPRRWVDFLKGILELDLRVHVHFGRPFDPVGNAVDARGRSHDPSGRIIDVARYFTIDGKLAEDATRDAEYTRTLSARLVAEYHRGTVALPTSVVAWALFARLRRAQRQPDLFRLLRTLAPDADASVTAVDRADVARDVQEIVTELEAAAARGDVRLAPELHDAEAAIDIALSTFGRYHAVPVVDRVGTKLRVRDANLLFYYRNRLGGVLHEAA
jgi:glycerol-3-phosphate O-acyltransferase